MTTLLSSPSVCLGQDGLTGTRKDIGSALGLTEEQGLGGEAASQPSLCMHSVSAWVCLYGTSSSVLQATVRHTRAEV